MKKFVHLFISLLCISCSSVPITKTFHDKKKIRLGVLSFKISAPIKRLSSIEESSEQNLTSEQEKIVVDQRLREIEDQATQMFIEGLRKSGQLEVFFISEELFGLERGKKPGVSQVEKICLEQNLDAIFYGEIPWYGKTRLLYPLLLASLDMLTENLVIGVMTNWNTKLLLANVGLEILTSTPLWFGGAYIFGIAFRPVSVKGSIIAANGREEIWSEAVDRVTSQKFLKTYSKEDQQKKEVQLKSSLKSATGGLANLVIGFDEEVDHMGSMGIMGGLSLVNHQRGVATGGFIADLNTSEKWRIGVQFDITAPNPADESTANIDLAVRRLIANWHVGLLIGMRMQMKSMGGSSVSEGENLNYGLSIGHDWKIKGTDLSLGPQINFIGSNTGPSLQTMGLVAIKVGFL